MVTDQAQPKVRAPVEHLGPEALDLEAPDPAKRAPAESVEDWEQIRQVLAALAARALESGPVELEDHLPLGQEAWLQLPVSPKSFSAEPA